MSQDPSDSESSALTHFSMSLGRKYVNLKEPYNHVILLKKDRVYMKSPTPQAECAKAVFQIQSPICSANLSNNISITQVKVNDRKN